jgi:uncharacterized protein
MPVQPTYPGVYIEELPSGVRTITGVSTSTAVFIGRTKKGSMNVPVLCLSFSDFERGFSSDYAGSELARQVRLFFENGGTKCYVVRIADGPKTSSVTLKTEKGTETLEVFARSSGGVGDKIRLAVTYRGTQPESTFNLEVFRWGQAVGGNLEKLDQEVLTGLSMDPTSPRYVGTWGDQNSKLVSFKDKKLAAAAEGYSESGRPVPARTNAIFRAQWRKRLGKESDDGANRFRISVDGGPLTDVDLSAIDFTKDPLDTDTKAVANLAKEVETVINNFLTGGKVTVTLKAGPTGKAGADNEKTSVLRISSVTGDVRIEPAAAFDLAGSLMLGTAQGGLDVSRFAENRPAPNGIVFQTLKATTLTDFAGLKQSAFNKLVVSGIDIGLGNALKTVPADPEARMYQDNHAATGNSSGVREKLGILATKVNEQRQADPNFPWTAEVWGSRLALLPVGAGDNSVGTIQTADGDGVIIGSSFLTNTTYYSLGASGTGGFQTPGAPGDDGDVPKLKDYREAFEVLRKEVDLFNLLLLPDDEEQTATDRASLWGPASAFCQERRAFLLIDAPVTWTDVQKATDPTTGVNELRRGLAKDYSAVFYPRLTIQENGSQVQLGASGAVAGLMARIDSSRGVWKAPAGTEADVRGIVGLERRFSDQENGVLNPRAINTLRVFSSGIVNWGARTLAGDDDLGSQWKYIPVRRIALYIEESLYRGTQWVVFEPNDEPLWSQIRLNVGAFMHTLFRQGAFQGKTPREAYLVKCDRETTTQDDINRGVVNILVGFAPLKPAEFVIIKIQQLAGQVQA